MKIRPVDAELFRADGQKDMMKLTAAFRNFAKKPRYRYDPKYNQLHPIALFV